MIKQYLNIFNNSQLKIFPTAIYQSSGVKSNPFGSRTHECSDVAHEHSFFIISNWNAYKKEHFFACRYKRSFNKFIKDISNNIEYK